ncbi:MAG: DUF362 domain-containing protein [Candidatus Heimdallarchaeota archaeon]|nr:DUF362 domain-containing protein [Candidatus Heimdallarchaeota archaeon]MCK4953790.1 DUF362 domain-containing protein [Candidatus Heimdallarchaeota archaeon]
MFPVTIVSNNVKSTDIDKVVFESLDSLKFTVCDNDLVVIKPNLGDFRPPEQGGTTNPLIVEALIKSIRRNSTCPIAIVESDHSLATADEEFERMGYATIKDKYDNIELVNLSADSKHRIHVDGLYFNELTVSDTLLRMTKYINVAKLKTHTQHRITCVLKNQFGLIARRSKKRYHPFLNEVILDLIELFPPTLSIIDGTTSMEGSGPSDGERMETELLIIGDDPFATDCVAAKTMGIKPLSVPVIKAAKREGFSQLKYEVKGEIHNYRFAQTPWYSFIIRRWGFRILRKSYKQSKKKQGRANFLSDVAAGFLVLKQGQYLTLQSGLIDRTIFWRVVKGMMKRPFVKIKLRVKGI